MGLEGYLDTKYWINAIFTKPIFRYAKNKGIAKPVIKDVLVSCGVKEPEKAILYLNGRSHFKVNFFFYQSLLEKMEEVSGDPDFYLNLSIETLQRTTEENFYIIGGILSHPKINGLKNLILSKFTKDPAPVYRSIPLFSQLTDNIITPSVLQEEKNRIVLMYRYNPEIVNSVRPCFCNVSEEFLRAIPVIFKKGARYAEVKENEKVLENRSHSIYDINYSLSFVIPKRKDRDEFARAQINNIKRLQEIIVELEQKNKFIGDNLKNTAKGQLQTISELVHRYHKTQDLALLYEAGTIYSLLENNLDLIKDTLTDSERGDLERRVIPLFAYELDEGIKGTRAERQLTYSTNDIHAVKSVSGLRFKSYKKPIAGKTEKIVLEAIAKINEAKNTGNFIDIGDIFGLSAENTEKLSPEIPLIRIPKFAYLLSRQRENDIVLCTDHIFGEDIYDLLPELNNAVAQGDDFAKNLKLAYFLSMNEKLAFLQHVNWEQIGVKETETADFSKDLEDSLAKLATHFSLPAEGIAAAAADISKNLHDKRLVNYRDYNAKHTRLYFRKKDNGSSLGVIKRICSNEELNPFQFIQKYAFDIDFDKFYRLVPTTEDRVNDRDCRFQLSEPETKRLNCHFLLNSKKFGYLFEGRREADDIRDMLGKLAGGKPCSLGSELADYESDMGYNLYRRDMRTAALTLGLLESSAQPEPNVALKHLSRAKTTVEGLPDRFIFLRELTADLLVKAEAKYGR